MINETSSKRQHLVHHGMPPDEKIQNTSYCEDSYDPYEVSLNQFEKKRICSHGFIGNFLIFEFESTTIQVEPVYYSGGTGL
ncbi:hypothetical protein L3Y34_004481 [Caenorhabditis briggsae]|uniref:Uncharacterized protein n=1 Tax=Caenorhabditis briggsae TaxID=6238 RepID=A0AAE9AFE4_CAEBR|nr:hypothetical protein L3Y34_004481 [Caenorhabditis briggsae]